MPVGLTLLDYCLTTGLFAPLVVAYWRGTWQLIDVYVFPEDAELRAWSSLIFGPSVILVLGLLQNLLARWITPSSKGGRISFIVGSRLYSILFAVACVNHWRGVWEVISYYTGEGPLSAGTTVLIGVVCLGSLRVLRNIIAPPFIVMVDAASSTDYFCIPTMFKSKGSANKARFMLDNAFSVLVVGSLVVFVWRGSWLLLDAFLFPEDPKWSAWASTALGFSIVIVCYPLQLLASKLSRKMTLLPRIVFEDSFLLFATFGAINVWRGVWALLDVYLFPENYLLSNWTSHIAGISGLLLMQNINTILVRGIYLDGENEDGSGCKFQVEYTRKLIKMYGHSESHGKRTSPEQKEFLDKGLEMEVCNSTTSATRKNLQQNCSPSSAENKTSLGEPSVALVDGTVDMLDEVEGPETNV